MDSDEALALLRGGAAGIAEWNQRGSASGVSLANADLSKLDLTSANLTGANLTRLHDKLLLVLSEASMKSEWVATEIAKARKRERKEGKRILFPVRLVEFERLEEWECFDADAGKDSAREVREYFIPDFSGWKQHDAFETACAKLLDALRASTAAPIGASPAEVESK